jgi:hypothetical protein
VFGPATRSSLSRETQISEHPKSAEDRLPPSCAGGPQWADSVEKLQIFPNVKFIYALTISKFQYTGREPKPTISSDRTTGELTY